MQEVMEAGPYAKLEEIKTDLNVLKSDVSSIRDEPKLFNAARS